MTVFPPPDLPEGRAIELAGRGTTFIREVAGPPGAPVLLLLHGWTANSALNWWATYGPLGEHFRVIAMDHRGHGSGIRSNRRFRLTDCADDAAALAAELGVERLVPVGYSMGGPIAQLMWLRHRELVGGMVLCATSRDFFRPGRSTRTLRGVVTGLGFAARATPVPIARRMHERVLVARYDETPLGMWARDETRRNDLRMLLEAADSIARFSSRDWIGGIDVPTAVVVTTDDVVVSPHRQRKLAESIPGATTHALAGGHDVCASDPERFATRLDLACAEVTTRAAEQRRVTR